MPASNDSCPLSDTAASCCSSTINGSTLSSCNSRFSEISSSTTRFFTQDFPSNNMRLEVRTKAPASTTTTDGPMTFTDELKIVAIRDLSSGALSTEVRTSLSFPIQHPKLPPSFSKTVLKSMSSLNSSGIINQNFTLCDPMLEGLKVNYSTTLNTSNSNGTSSSGSSCCKGCKVGAEWRNGIVAGGTSIDLSGKNCLPRSLNGDISFKIRDFIIAGDISFNPRSKTIERHAIGVGFDRLREKVSLQVNGLLKGINAAYYQKFTDNLELAFKANWTIPATLDKKALMSGASDLGMEIGAKYIFTPGFGNWIKTKIDNAGHLGLSLGNEVRPNLQFTIGALIDTLRLKDGNAHRFGLDLSYEA